MVKWDLEQIYNFKNTEVMINNLKIKVAKFEKNKEKLNDNISSKEFIQLIKEAEDIITILQKLGGYASLQYAENTTSGDNNAHLAKISELSSEIDNKLMFFSHWFKKLPDKKAQELIDASGKYKYYLQQARSFKDYMLEENEEKIINIKDLSGNDVLTRIYDIITNQYTYDWEGKNISQEELKKYVKSPNRNHRKKAYNLLLEKYAKDESALGEIYKSLVLDWKNENIKLRGFKTPISVRNKANDISDKTIETLMDVVRKNSELFREYFSIKAKMLNLKDFSRYDIYAPLKNKEKKYTYAQCKKIVLDTYKNFSQKAYEYANEIFEQNHVDSDLREGKQSGAFCATIKKDITPYVLLNFTGTGRDLFTMMHELGHGIHGRAAKDQTEYTYHSALPLAETASIFGETLLRNRLIKKADAKDKLSMIAEHLDDVYASILRQIYFVIFEKQAHDLISKGCTIKDINNLYMFLLKEQFGNSLIIPDIFKHEWKYVPHIYHTPFYCYAYGFGNLVGLSLYKLYNKDENNFPQKYMNLLASGGSNSPGNLLKENLGVNIEDEMFWQAAFDMIKYDVEELKKLIKVEKLNNKIK